MKTTTPGYFIAYFKVKKLYVGF